MRRSNKKSELSIYLGICIVCLDLVAASSVLALLTSLTN